MKRRKLEKSFDCIRFKRKVQAEIYWKRPRKKSVSFMLDGRNWNKSRRSADLFCRSAAFRFTSSPSHWLANARRQWSARPLLLLGGIHPHVLSQSIHVHEKT
jgi:hypothetical protein